VLVPALSQLDHVGRVVWVYGYVPWGGCYRRDFLTTTVVLSAWIFEDGLVRNPSSGSSISGTRTNAIVGGSCPLGGDQHRGS
jgi:hypothetical protein